MAASLICKSRKTAPLLGLLATLALSGCNSYEALYIKDAKVVMKEDDRDGILEFTVNGGVEDVRLVGVQSPSVIRVAPIDPQGKDMNTRTNFPIPAEKDTRFEKGKNAYKLYGINLYPRRIGKIELTFIFSNDDRQVVEAPLVEPDEG